jgi:hypothetical protein
MFEQCIFCSPMPAITPACSHADGYFFFLQGADGYFDVTSDNMMLTT